MERKKCIVHVVIDVNGGIGSVVMNLINYQLNQGHDVVLVYSEYFQQFFDMLDSRVVTIKKDIKKFPGSYMLNGLNIPQIYKDISVKYKNRNIIIHAHNVASIGVLANIKRIPLICTIHGISKNGIKSTRGYISEIIYKYILKKMIKNKKIICAVSNNTRVYYENLISSSSIKVVHNGVSIPKIKISKKNKFIIGHVGDISYSKGWDTVLKAISLLPEDYKNNVEFRFAGKILDISEDEIKQLLKEYKLDRNAFYLGRVANAVRNVIPNLSVLILASISEGLPMVILEAQGLGIPVIATDVGGIKEVIKDGVNGFIVEKNPEVIKNKIIELIDDNKKYNNMKYKAKEIFKSDFSVDKMGKKYEYYYSLFY